VSYEHPIASDHEAVLKSILRLDETEDLPPEVLSGYHDLRRCLGRVGEPVSTQSLVLLCLLLNRPSPPDPVSFIDVKAEPDTRVLAHYRGSWRWGTFKYYRGRKVFVQVDDDTATVREFGPTKVRVPTKTELATL
jgi:hypothetical protein